MPVAVSYATRLSHRPAFSKAARFTAQQKSAERKGSTLLMTYNRCCNRENQAFASVRMQDVHRRRETNLSFSRILTF